MSQQSTPIKFLNKLKIVKSNNSNDGEKKVTLPEASPSSSTPQTTAKFWTSGGAQRALFEEGDGPASHWKEIAIEHRKTLDQLQSTLDAREEIISAMQKQLEQKKRDQEKAESDRKLHIANEKLLEAQQQVVVEQNRRLEAERMLEEERTRAIEQEQELARQQLARERAEEAALVEEAVKTRANLPRSLAWKAAKKTFEMVKWTANFTKNLIVLAIVIWSVAGVYHVTIWKSQSLRVMEGVGEMKNQCGSGLRILTVHHDFHHPHLENCYKQGWAAITVPANFPGLVSCVGLEFGAALESSMSSPSLVQGCHQEAVCQDVYNKRKNSCRGNIDMCALAINKYEDCLANIHKQF